VAGSNFLDLTVGELRKIYLLVEAGYYGRLVESVAAVK
jgi:hypothetical protein